jgi:hypothetical protein
MPPVIIDNPILNSPYREPTRHFRFDASNQITSTIDEGRRDSSYFLPVAAPKKRGAPGLFDDPEEKRAESGFVQRIRQLVRQWRRLGWPDVTPVTRALLEHWHAEDRFRPLFFCQLEALETLIFITEVAKESKYGHDDIEAYLRDKAREAGTELFRVACKMATGSGKTVVMSMLIAWQVLNKRRNPRDNRFTDAFLVVATGITIRDRLRVLLPSDPNNYYKELDLVPTEYRGELGAAKVVVTNFHAFKPREKGDAGGLTKRLLTAHTPGAFTESPEEMVNRVCNDLGKHRGIMVLNDEAHHCYRGRPEAAKEKMTREESSEAKVRAEEARLWITGLEAVHRKLGVKAVLDLSATPFYLKGSGYPEGTLFPWVVSDFSLMDAIECGIVKIPRVPVADNAMVGDYPKYRDLWKEIREGLKDVRRGPEEAHKPPLLPDGLLEGASASLYGHYARKFSDEDLMREVLNTVGKKGKLGEHIRCVVSVSMLTEGWDCKTVTHILGVRAFGTRLLCEQVMGRGLRRRSYTVGDDGLLTPEYADIFGVPFSGCPVAGLPEERTPPTPKPGKAVRAMPERLLDNPWLEVTFPRVIGYRFDVPAERLTAKFDATHRETLTTQEIPTLTISSTVVGGDVRFTLDEAKALRPQTVAFQLATHLQQHHFPDRPWLFPQLLTIVRDWFGDPDGDSPFVEYGDDTFPGLLVFGEKKSAVCEKIFHAILAEFGGERRIRAELPETDFLGTTAGVSFDTIKDCWTTDPAKCHFNLVPQDSDWETVVCQKLEEMEEVRAYAKNQALGFRIPYTCEGRPGSYYPDLIVKLDDGRGTSDLLNLVLEVSGQKKREKDAKVQTAKTMWAPGVNNLGTFGRWAFLEIDGSNLHKAKQTIRQALAAHGDS